MRIVLFPFVLLFAACTSQIESGNEKTVIVCTTGMIGDAVNNLVDSNCVVHTLMGPGVDPHLFKPTKSSLDLLSEANFIVANGLHLEGKMIEILEKMEGSKKVIFLGNAFRDDELIKVGENTEAIDPHIWFDVDLWKQAIQYLSGQLENESFYNSNSASLYIESLDTLHQWVNTSISEIPLENRVLITAHDAFEYFGKAYDLEVRGLQGISTAAEYGVRDVSDMVNLILEREIKAVFVESSVSERSIEAVIQGCAQQGLELKLGGTLYSDAMGAEGSGADTYIGMVEHNVNAITQSLK